jgi:hypothetical protein
MPNQTSRSPGTSPLFSRRKWVGAVASAGLVPLASQALPQAEGAASLTLLGAAWRGPGAQDPYFAGVLAADWQRQTLTIRYAVPLPTRAHGLLPEAGGGLLVNGVRPGGWLLRCDGAGQVMQRLDVSAESAHVRLSGHVVAVADHLFTTEIDYRSDQGRIGVRDRHTLRKLDEWASGGIEPHQLLPDPQGHLMVANGGVRRTLEDRKFDVHRMDSSLVRLDGRSGRPLGHWKLDDPRLSLRHLAWSGASSPDGPRLGVAMQAEHDDPAQRAAAPILAVLEGDRLHTPAGASGGRGYAGDISPAYDGGFALSSNQAALAQLWHPALPEQLTPFVQLKEAYALAGWPGVVDGRGGGVLVATAIGLVRWHPRAEPVFLRWPLPMALDNHWVLMS